MQDKTLRDKFLKWLLNASDLNEKQARTMAFVYDKLDEWTTAKYGVSLYSGDVDRIMAVFTLMFKKGEFRDFKDPVLLVGRFLSFMAETNGVSAGRSNSPLGGGVENGPALIDSYLDFKNDNINEYEFRIRLLMGEVSFKMVSALTPKGRRLLQKFEREGKDLDDLTEKEHAKLAEETLHVPLIGEREGKNYVFVAIDAGNEGEYIKTPFLPVLFTVFKDPNVDGVIVVSEEYEELGPYILEADDVEQLVGVVNMMAEQNLDDDRDEHPQDEPQRVPVPEPTHSKPRKRHGSDGVPQDVDSDISKWSRLENCEPDNTQPVGISINNLRDNCAISFVRCQKGISAIRGIRLINNTYETLEGLRIRVRSNEGYFKDFEAAFPFPIQRGKISKPWSLDLVPTQKALPQGNSSANNNLFHTPITIEVIQDGKTLGKTSTKVWILPKYFCEFAFINDLPVFVLPDDPVVKELRTKTADILMQNTDSSSTEGYQSGKTRVVEMCKAAYEAVQSLELGYSNPPANANDLDGQRLRVPSEVKASHAGTCMDMTLLYAALVEQMGLYPILILVEGHIFCGVWLDAREHDKFLLDEKRRLKFLINKPELQSYFDCRRVIFVECTTMCRDNKSVGFEKSIDIARKDRFRNMPFNLAIDVQNARQLGVAALPDQADGDGAITIVRNTGVNASKGAAPVVRPPKTATALDRWEKELLDLDPERNLLLDLVNRGDDTPAIPFFTAHIGELEDRLADKQPFDVVALPINDIYCKKGIKECLNIGNKLLHNFYQGCGPEDELDVFSRFPFEAAEIEDGEKLDGIELELFLKDQTCQQHRLYPLQPLERNSLIRLWMGIKSVCGQVLAMEKGDPALIEQAVQAIVRIYDPKGKDFDKAEAAVNKLFKDSMLKLRDFRSSFDALFEQNKKNVLETGSSSLYMCFGVLRWHAPDEKVAHYAPLILEPIDIEKRGTSQFVVKLRERDEIRFNGTLIQLMKEKFNIDLSELDPVPCDDSGADVAGVFETIRRKLSALDECCGWEVLEICAAADLKFDNFEIWHDLHTLGNEQLLKTPIVDAMTAGDSRFHQNWDDDAIAKTQVAAVFPYDDAQRKAVQAAFSGLDFALIGGAGVGKTQAAANILANAIWKKKRTLVVAEEKEFLDQIKGMLDEVGLSDFTLSLYDADTKDEVWKRVAKSLERVENGRWDEETGFAQDLSGLNDVESELESRYKNLRTKKGDGLYDLLTLCDSVPSDSPLKLDPADVQKMSKFDVEKTFRADFNRLVECGQKTTPEQRTQFSQIRAAEISANLKELALDYQESLKLVKRFGRALAKQIGSIDGAFTEPRTKNDYFSLDAALAFYTDSKASGAVYAIFENAELTDALNEYYADAAKLRQALEILLDEWKSEEALLAIRVDECSREYEHSAAKKLFTSSRKALADKLNALRKKPLAFEAIPSRLRQVEAYQRGVKRLEERLAALPESCKTALERWSGRDEFDAARKEFQQFHELAESDPRKSAIGKALRENPNIQRYAVEYRGAYARFSETSRKFNAAIKRETPVCEDWIAEESDFCGFIAQNVDKLKGWAAYASAREECVKKGMRALVEEYERSYNASGLYDRFRKGFYQAAIDSIVSRPYWAKFSRERYEERLSSYRELFGKYLRSTAKEIAKRHAKDFIASKNSDQIKTEEFKFRQLERRECTIRELVRTTPHLLFALCPCVLATPQDVAACFSDYQGSGVFDLAIIGNADTLPAVKALGAIARSKHTIAAADPVLTEKRSLYDAFSNVCTDKLRLTRHYRSKNGALIAYSNKNTYEGKLAAAPAFYDPNPRVKAVCVDGSDYDEAAAVCAELLRRYNDKGLRKQTAAIVAFSEKQWTLLDSLLNKLKERDPRFEAWVDKFTALQRLDKELHDHEVDAMLISTGNLDTSVNYLKTKGAERWFAYAATRAKESIAIFSTNESRDIRPNGTESAGLAALYHFMVYAETGRLNSISFDDEKKRAPERGLAFDVCQAVQEAGFDYELQVGPNGLAVDVAVVDKELRGRGYVLGILFDDVDLKTWRENRQRCEFLQNAGWKRLYRVYARDYYNNRVETIAALKEFLTQVKAELEEEKSAPKSSELDNKLFEDVKRLWREIKKDDDFIAEIEELDKEEGGVEEDYDEDAFEEETAQAFNAPNEVDEEDEEEGFDDDSESYESEEDEDSVPASSAASGSSGSALYPNDPIELAAFELPITETTAEDYVLRANRDAIVERIERLVAASAPIRKDALLQEIHRSFGIKRASGAVVGATNRALKAANVVVKVEKSIVLPKTKDGSVGKREKVEYCWRMDQDPKRYADIRVSNARKIDFVCLQEARNAMCLVLIKKGPMKKQDLVKETYNLLGFKRGGKLVVESLEFVFDQIKGKDIKAVKKGRDPEYAFIGEA